MPAGGQVLRAVSPSQSSPSLMTSQPLPLHVVFTQAVRHSGQGTEFLKMLNNTAGNNFWWPYSLKYIIFPNLKILKCSIKDSIAIQL